MNYEQLRDVYTYVSTPWYRYPDGITLTFW